MKADEVYAILKKRISMSGATDEQVQNAVNAYLTAHPVTVKTDKTLKLENIPADAKAVGEALNKLTDDSTGGIYKIGLEKGMIYIEPVE